MKRFFFCAALLLCAFPAFAAEKESAYDRVMKTQTIRCGYGTNKPWIYRDEQTGKLVGLNVDIMQAIADQLGLKLEWPEETGWGDLPIAMQSGRFDVACSSLWTDPVCGMHVAYPTPLFYMAIHAFARADDARFSAGTMETINDPATRLAVQDGDFSMIIAKRFFPKAQMTAIPSNAQWNQTLQDVIAGKADIVFSDSTNVSNFNENNEKKLVRVPLPEPVSLYGNALAVGIQEHELKEMIDTVVKHFIYTGKMDELTADFRRKYPDALILPERPYRQN